MGLFNQVFGTKADTKVAMNSAEAFAAICLVAIASDGYLSEQEEAEMNILLNRMKLFQDCQDGLDRMKDYLVNNLKKYGPNELVKSAKAALPSPLHSTVFAVAVDLVFSDGTVSPEEKAFIDDLRRILAIPDDMAVKIVEVMTIKNQG